MQTNPKSKCCGADVILTHGCDSDSGHGGKKCNCELVTSWHECVKCRKPCDIMQTDHTVPKQADRLIDSSFQTEYSSKSPCGCQKSETVTYRLQIRIDTSTDVYGKTHNRWWAWWEPEWFASHSTPPQRFGDYMGTGERSLDEAIGKAMETKDHFLKNRKND